MVVDHEPCNQCRDHLQNEFLANRQAFALLFDQHQVVVKESDESVAQGDEQDDPHEIIGQIAPQQRRHGDGEHNQGAAHGRRARFAIMGFGSVFADVLTDLQLPQLADHPRTEQETDEESRQAGINGPERDVPEHIEYRYDGMQRIEQVINHRL